MQDPERPIVATSVRPVYASRWWQVEEHDVVHADGTPGMFNVLYCGDGVTVLAVTSDGELYLIREYKYAISRHILQLPSGGVDDGEQPLQAAVRELLEETGLAASTWTSAGIVHPYPTNVAATVHLFIAHDARPVQDPEPGIDLLRVDRGTALDLIAKHEVTHAASLACLLTYLLHSASGSPPTNGG
ncbi:NUDIX hydrolase [Dactylosporangium cerinum]